MNNTVENDIDQINKALDKFEQERCYLPPINNDKYPDCLSISLEELRKKTPEELNEFIFVISRYSLNLQRIINKNKAISRWIKSKLEEAMVTYIEETDPSLGYYNRAIIAKTKPEICQKLNSLGRRIEMETERLFNVPEHLKMMSDAINNIKFTSIRAEKYAQN